MTKNKNLTNKFFGISRFPKGWGKIFFPISLSKIQTAQSPKEILDCLGVLQKAVQENKIGCDVVYGDMLYMWNVDRNWKEYSMKTIEEHKKGFTKELLKRKIQFQIEEAFCFYPWSSLYLEYNKSLYQTFLEIKSLTDTDPDFKKYLMQDAETIGRDLTDTQIGFFVEEHLSSYRSCI
ncbi:MAG: hypothetical protein ACKOW9_01600 [Candidatus Paceibacterota bacterium]